MRITQAAYQVGVSISTLKRLEQRELIRVRKDRNGQRRYTDEKYIWNLARVHGTNVNRDYAEVFQVYRIVA